LGASPSEVREPSALIRKIFSAPKGHPLHYLGLQMLKRDVGMEVLGMTTGRYIVVVEPDLVKKYMGNLSNEGEYREVIKEYLKRIEDSLSSDEEREETNELFKTLRHEYYHWYILKETSVATVIDALSWMIRFLQITLTEIFHRKTNFERRVNFDPLNEREAIEKLRRLDESINEIVENPENLELFQQLIYHINTLYYIILSAIKFIVEPVTWALTEDLKKCQQMLKNYFPKGERRWASDILSKTLDLKVKGVDKLSILGFARQSLDVSLEQINNYLREGEIKEGEKTYNNLAEYFYDRFINLISNTYHHEISKKKETYATVVSYIFNHSSKVNATLTKIISEILAEENEALNFIMKIATAKVHEEIYKNPGVFTILPDSLNFYRYDPLAGLTSPSSKMDAYVKRTGMTFQSFEDLVGDLPLTHRTFILSIRDRLTGIKSSCARLLSYYERITGEETYDKILEESIKIGEWSAEKFIRLHKGDIDKGLFRDYLRSWSYMIFRLGRKALLLRGLHGIW
jgi:uncharacterized protein YaaR (DUF327 family)